MDEERTNKPSAVWIVVIVLLLACVPLYLLSTGPAVWLCSRGAITTETVRTAYAPMHWLELRSPGFSRALNWYVGLWWKSPPPPPAATPASS